MKYFFIIILLSTISCSKIKENDNVKLTDQNSIEKLKEIKIKNNFDKLLTENIWQILINKKGCLTGGQYVYDGKIGGEGCIMSNSIEWKLFFMRPKDELTNFLVTRLDKRDTTKVHTCPFFLATEGELATYALQGVHRKNWFDFDEFKIYEQKVSNPKNEMLGSRDNFQGYLNDKVLTKTKEREKLKRLWLNELKK